MELDWRLNLVRPHQFLQSIMLQSITNSLQLIKVHDLYIHDALLLVYRAT